jgi:hypothetical protein
LLAFDEKLFNTIQNVSSPKDLWRLESLKTGGRIVVFGLINAGKSTFLNGIINKHLSWPLNTKVLPTSVNVCTFFNTELEFTATDKIHISINKKIYDDDDYYQRQELSESYDIEDYASIKQYLKNNSIAKTVKKSPESDKRFITKEFIENNDTEYVLEYTENITIKLPKIDIMEGLILIDTPGFGGIRDSALEPQILVTIKNANKAICVIDEEYIRSDTLKILIEEILPGKNNPLLVDAVINLQHDDTVEQNVQDIKAVNFYRKFRNIGMMNILTVMNDFNA